MYIHLHLRITGCTLELHLIQLGCFFYVTFMQQYSFYGIPCVCYISKQARYGICSNQSAQIWIWGGTPQVASNVLKDRVLSKKQQATYVCFMHIVSTEVLNWCLSGKLFQLLRSRLVTGVLRSPLIMVINGVCKRYIQPKQTHRRSMCPSVTTSPLTLNRPKKPTRAKTLLSYWEAW